ncbi:MULTISPECIES: ectoine/hydroxyectoine ABC transporter substrate-binding protein EhuB [Streptomyces]|uniref:Ectoine/hydroxyectoine ABC transporter substrate-binding protein EhuB n=3 Tax=Streptomyces TaxID=1883 RepID=A0A8A1UR35_STRR1|nr:MULTISPECIES: ectoine/hydroxyectoine ABC transporter substrate-binding protein EhuB [Streptomyces]MYT48438.1 ectoine/hydroxyectoine ABC transporter substrate-binding protein EhuB [Streptomyces sp. SID5471]KEF03938.1 amino acid ABC transporter substrate-binding protein [Streptomyces rimosus]QDA06698.1 ectoine/hydroxyectoine ABC transporter substrate-binding protein EhuB [Streptomyces rimosus]QEV77972.1 ectoine/hydroxyectoine ABC transporter substrate-binding protein EhuB [Streptomyces rimosus
MAPPQGNSSGRNASGFRRRSLLAGAAALGLTGAFGAAATGCSRVDITGATDGGHLLDDLRSRKVVRMGIASEPPYASINSQGELTGEAPAVAKTIFQRLGVERFEPVPVEFGALVPGLHSFQYDVIVAGMFINKARCQAVLFSDPDYESKDGFLVPKGNPKKIASYRDVARGGLRMGTGIGYAEIDYAVGNGVAKGKIQTYGDQIAGMEALEADRIDCFAGTALTMMEALKTGKHPKVEMTHPFTPEVDGKPQRDGGGYGFRIGETKLRDAFNRELHQMKKSGELLRIARPFGFTEEFMTDLTAKELCAR